MTIIPQLGVLTKAMELLSHEGSYLKPAIYSQKTIYTAFWVNTGGELLQPVVQEDLLLCWGMSFSEV